MQRDVARQYERYRTDGVSWFGAAELLPPNMHLVVVACVEINQCLGCTR